MQSSKNAECGPALNSVQSPLLYNSGLPALNPIQRTSRAAKPSKHATEPAHTTLVVTSLSVALCCALSPRKARLNQLSIHLERPFMVQQHPHILHSLPMSDLP